MLDVDGKANDSLKFEVDFDRAGSFMKMEDNKLVIDDLTGSKVKSGFYKIKLTLTDTDEDKEILHQYVTIYIHQAPTQPDKEELPSVEQESLDEPLEKESIDEASDVKSDGFSEVKNMVDEWRDKNMAKFAALRD